MVSDDNPGDEGKKGNLEGDAGIQLGFLRHFITPIPKIPGDFPSNIVKYTYKYVKNLNNQNGDFQEQNPIYKKVLVFLIGYLNFSLIYI